MSTKSLRPTLSPILSTSSSPWGRAISLYGVKAWIPLYLHDASSVHHYLVIKRLVAIFDSPIQTLDTEL